MFRKTRTVVRQTREEKNEEKAAERAEFAKLPAMKIRANVDQAEPEFASIDAFAEFLFDDGRETFSVEELENLRKRLTLRDGDPIAALAGYGLRLIPRKKEKEIRGFSSNPYTLFAGNPGSGGSGFDAHGPGAVRGRSKR